MHRCKTIAPWLALLAALGPLAGCQAESGTPESAATMGAPEVVMVLPLTTTSPEARTHFMAGTDANDVGRIIDAREHFRQAVQADPAFALGYLELANAAASVDEFTGNLKRAEEHQGGASRAEQLLIEITRKGFDRDVEGQLRAAGQLVEAQPESPRAWLALAGIQTGLNRSEEARESIGRALELAPNMAAAHMALGNSYLFNDPKDLALAEQHMQHAVEIRPEEPNPYDFLGDVHRALGQLEKARDDYTKAAERSPDDGSPIQQRAHVNSFLGDYAAARADYDRSIAMARANQAPVYAMFKAFVHVHADDPQAAIDELTMLTDAIDGMQIPEPTGVKIGTLSAAVTIALHHGFLDQAEKLGAREATLRRAQAKRVGTDASRRGQEANIAYTEAVLAAKRGSYAMARKKADEMAKLLEPDANPRKMEPVHEVLGIIALEQKKGAEAVTHLRQGNLNNTYTEYLLARALEAAGQTEESKAAYARVANNNFNSVGFALTRKEAAKKAVG